MGNTTITEVNQHKHLGLFFVVVVLFFKRCNMDKPYCWDSTKAWKIIGYLRRSKFYFEQVLIGTNVYTIYSSCFRI